MRILVGVFPPTSGRAIVAGYDVLAEPLRARRVVGYFPERVSIYLDLTVAEYLAYVARLKDMGAAARRQAAVEVMRACGIEHVRGRIVGTLSKGYRQRVGIAQALIGDPHVLILDEPTSGLDPEQVAEIRALIKRLRGDRTVILSTHILSEVEATCDRVIIINGGRVLAVDTPANLNQRLRHHGRIHVEVEGPEREVGDRLAAVPGVLEVQCLHRLDGVATFDVSTTADQDLRPVIAAMLTGAGWGLRELRPVSLSLEEIFLTLVSGREGGGDPTLGHTGGDQSPLP
jgi:ABC-2 type transport system ATP-binding protein